MIGEFLLIRTGGATPSPNQGSFVEESLCKLQRRVHDVFPSHFSNSCMQSEQPITARTAVADAVRRHEIAHPRMPLVLSPIREVSQRPIKAKRRRRTVILRVFIRHSIYASQGARITLAPETSWRASRPLESGAKSTLQDRTAGVKGDIALSDNAGGQPVRGHLRRAPHPRYATPWRRITRVG